MGMHGNLEFHARKDRALVEYGYWTKKPAAHFTYTFENFFHPFVSELIEQLNRTSLPGLFDPVFQESLAIKFFDKFYAGRAGEFVTVKSFPKELDLQAGGPYANYNWELLFHVPLTIAVHLSKNQRFAEARHWFHYIFDPTSNDAATPVPQRFWKFLAFRRPGRPQQIDEQLANLSTPAPETVKLLEGLEAIRNDPFQPHKVARTRQLAYQYYVVMKYLDNLIAWGDHCFQQDTVESITEATQLYVLAANLLGHRPQRIPRFGAVRPKTFAELKKRGLDPLGNALVELEGKFPLNLGTPRVEQGDPEASGPLFGIGRTLYFCIPRNEKMLSYWDTVGDRLFKIRHCMNLEGVVRQLALYDPPIDPGMLVKAAAAGIDVSAVVSGLHQPLSPVRPLMLIQQALELCTELRGLGAALLSTIEKGDTEQLAALRQGHEIRIQQRQQDVRFLQWASAQEATKSLLVSRGAALERLNYYQRLLDLPPDPGAPETLPVSFDGLKLDESNFAAAYNALVGQYDKQVARQGFPALHRATGGRARLLLNNNEDEEFEHLKRARDTGLLSSAAHALAASFVTIPDAKANLHFWGLGGTMDVKVGTALSSVARFAGNVLGIISSWERDQAGMTSRTAGYERRADEWVYQHNLAAHELMQIGRQILTSLIAEQIAFHEYTTLKSTIENAQEVDRFLRSKFSNQELYGWLQGELSRIYYEYYRFASDTARKAERAMKQELLRPEVDDVEYVKFNYWDAGRKGLLSAETLYLDLKRMELAYHENNKREYELTRHVSLRQLDPAALLTLRASGRCELNIPEWLFDLDTPGHYMRRIRSVAVTIPCVVGPYASVGCTLTSTKSSLRTSPLISDGYARTGSEDGRFRDYFSANQSIVTSSGQNDSGLFEPSVRDERLLPFEGAGAVSSWKLELPATFRQFDYRSISDVVLHVRYTAREGGRALRDAALAAVEDILALPDGSGLGVLLSLRHDFPNEWSAFLHGAADFSAVVRRMHFPYLAQGRKITIHGLELFGQTGTDRLQHHSTGGPEVLQAATTALDEDGEFVFTAAADAAGPTQALTRSPAADVWLIVQYTLAP
ncbi:hypothetical protein AB0M36_07450 [Actinoplanes sp. NPDC051346]|uniref:Tc toxin subunit A-related protein n=1 Tax=Actinoplanes sp. NPDC051346 TaxID=3155048 RepID=UPI0034239044